MRILLMAAALLGAARLQAKAFEGRIEYKFGVGGQEQRMEMSVQGGRLRSDSSVGGVRSASIVNVKERKVIALLLDQKKYMVHRIKDTEAKLQPKAKFEKTGRSESIAGYKAEEWKVTVEGDSYSLWGTGELGSMLEVPGGQGMQGMQIPEELKKKGLLLLRMDGQVRMEAVAVKPGKVDPSLFEIPAGFTETSMGGAAGGAGAEGGAESREALRKAMESMSPEQKAMLEKLMKGKGGN